MKRRKWYEGRRAVVVTAVLAGLMGTLAISASAAPKRERTAAQARRVAQAKEQKQANGSKDWAVVLVPASLKKDHAVNLAANEVQMIVMAIQASQRVRARGETHQFKVEVDMPPGMTCLDNAGPYKVTRSTTTTRNGRNVLDLSFDVPTGRFNGTPGAQLRQEANGQKLYVSAPKSIPADEAYLEIRLIDGQEVTTHRWPVALTELAPPAVRPKRIVLGLWSVAMMYAGKASNGIGKLLHDSGIRYISQDEIAGFREAMKAHGILVGGHMYYGLYADNRAMDQNAAGKELKGEFPNPQALSELPKGTAIPGVSLMIQRARQGSGMATMDFEPVGVKGFAPAAVTAFKKQYNVSDAAFAQFRGYVAQHALKTFQTTDPQIKKIWLDWTAFCTTQSANYVRMLHTGLKAGDPTAKLLVTCGFSFGSDTLGTISHGGDCAAMSPYADVMMPQFYLGYEGKSVKQVMQWTRGWRAEMSKLQAKSQLWPLLLIRYAGATPYNTPERLREQILGTIAEGSEGAIMYYPANMDGTYWSMMAKTAEDVAKYEDFYLDGKRVENQFAATGMPEETTTANVSPGYPDKVVNPDWAVTAHELNGQVLLTLFNLQEGKEQVFHFDHPGLRAAKAENAEAAGAGSWRVPANSVGFVVVSASGR